MSQLEDRLRAPATSQRRLALSVNPKLGWGSLGIALFLLTWQIAGMNTSPIFFSTPTAVASAAGVVFEHGNLLEFYLNTMRVYAIGIVAASVLGIGFGVLTGLNPRARYLIDPIAIALYTTPSLVMIPIFVIWFGITDEVKIALILFSGVFPPLINTQLGIDQMGPLMNELGRSFGANRREMLVKIVLPSILPFAMAGIRLAVPRAFVSIIAAEMLVTAGGIGGLILRYGNQFQTAFYFVPVILIVITSYVMTELVKLLEHTLTPWRRSS